MEFTKQDFFASKVMFLHLLVYNQILKTCALPCKYIPFYIPVIIYIIEFKVNSFGLVGI